MYEYTRYDKVHILLIKSQLPGEYNNVSVPHMSNFSLSNIEQYNLPLDGLPGIEDIFSCKETLNTMYSLLWHLRPTGSIV